MRLNHLPSRSQLLGLHLPLQRSKGGGVSEPRLGSASLAPGQGSLQWTSTPTEAAWQPETTQEGATEEQAGYIWQRGNALSISSRTTTGKIRVGSRGHQGSLAWMLSFRALPRMNQLSSGCCQFLERKELMLVRERAKADRFKRRFPDVQTFNPETSSSLSFEPESGKENS